MLLLDRFDDRGAPPGARRRLSRAVLTLAALSLVTPSSLLTATAAQAAAAVTTASFSGGTGTVSVAGALYARSGGALTLTVTAPSDTVCVDVAGAFTGHQQSTTARTAWTFTTTAGAGDGVQGVTVAASPSVNPQNKCTGTASSGQASYTLDNIGPLVTGALTPAPNAAGWNRTNATLAWTATDAGSGVAAGPTPASSSETASGVRTRTSSATDRLGNTGTGSLTVRVDKDLPTITASKTSAGYGQPTTVTFTCDDPPAAGAQASGIASCLADGETTNARTIPGNGTVTGTATDRAGNVSTLSVPVQNVDTTAPTLSGAPASAPNAAGWYSGDVTVKWTAADPESGIPSPPADTTIGGEGTGLTSTQTVTNGGGLSTTATSPAVSIDRTAPTTSLTGAPDGWVNGQVTLSLAAQDALSGVASTTYSVDGGPATGGTGVTLSTEGEHTVTYSSTDVAGNAETPRTAHVRIDKTAPAIGHAFTPASYTDGAWANGDVTVTFTCTDAGGSGLAGCTGPSTVTDEGSSTVTGSASDGAGNTATDEATVRVDRTPPVVTASADREPNAAGWYSDDVTVSWVATDALSGVAEAPAAVVLGEGADKGASGTATDAAGNSADAGVSGIDVDKTPPVLTADVPAGWHRGDVTVAWSCADALSGPAAQPADEVVTGEGANLSSTATCTDLAGNVAAKTVGGIRIDRHAPVTTASVPEVPASGWYTGDVEVTLAATDGLSGVGATVYAVDGGTPQAYEGPFTVSADGVHVVTFHSTDVAGNVEEAPAPLTLRVDRTAPVTTLVEPISPASGWFVTSGLPVAFEVAEAGSGTAATYYEVDGGDALTYGEPFTADLSTGRHTLTWWSVDVAGNAEERRTVELNVDTVAPSIVGAQTPAANAFGWNNTPVDVTFACTDADSGIDGVAGCAGDTTLSNEGDGQRVVGDAVDVAGNRSATTYGPVAIDTTRPTLSGSVPDANGAGWYRDDVPVTWVADDALSGVDPATQPAPSVVSGEGADLGAGPVKVSDRAGNTSEPASVTGLKIDRTAPVVTGEPTTRPNAAGWYRNEVTVDYTCSDALSGVASCPTSSVVRGDGADQSVTGGTALDVAGNVGAGATVSGIDVDGTAPVTTSDNQCSAVNGWCKGDVADVVLSATDQPGLSGVAEVHYAVDGGDEQVVESDSTTVRVPLTGSGAGTVTYWAVDVAGNAEARNSVSLKWDNIAPTVTHALSPAPNAEDWNNTDVTVTFAARDDDHGSGVASTTAPVVVTEETAGRVVTGTADDTAGNVGTDRVTVRLDRTAPVITGAVTAGTRTASGWYSGPVTVTFTCSDALSGVASCPDPVVLSANGTNTASGVVTDRAGNTASATVAGIRIDQERPALTAADVSVAGGTYTLGAVPAATCTATDSLSGVASCAVTATGGRANGVGTWTWTAVATDRAGNTSAVSGTYRVVYRFDGFLQPVNDTAHQVGVATSVFKAGSTVPAKFQLKKADGTLVQAGAAPVWVTPVKGGVTSAPVDETLYGGVVDSGSTYRWDAGQYIYNWKTGSGGNYWRMGVLLDDGQTYFVNIGLR